MTTNNLLTASKALIDKVLSLNCDDPPSIMAIRTELESLSAAVTEGENKED